MDSENGYILIGTASIILFIFLLAFLAILLIYRKRKLEHAKEVEIMNERFSNQLLQTQLEVQQQTMQYIGREIHDNVGQKLTLASLYTQQIDHKKQYPAINERISEVSNIINESLTELRSLSKSLTSDYVSQTDLITLIENECNKVNATGTCLVNFKSSINDMNLSYQAKNIVLRIIQEFIQNSLKHAECSLLQINIDEEKDGVMIGVNDNGKGFSEDETGGKGVGLINIKKRAEAIGASVKIESKLGVGTNMQLCISTSKIHL